MIEQFLSEVENRYGKALDAKPSKGNYTADGIFALTDSVCDIPDLLKIIREGLDSE